MENYTSDGDVILDRVSNDVFRHLLPVIVCMIMFGVVGIIGNILTFIFYAFKSKRSSTVMLIACLAMVDLIVCILFIPNIVEMWVNVKYTASFICKLAHFIGLWTVAASGLILWVVAIDRHRKICSPFGKQMTLVTTKYSVIAIVVFGFFLSVRNFANFDSVEVDIKDPERNITGKGRYCTTRDDSNYIVSVTIFTVIDFLLMLMVWVTLAVAYSHIIYTIFKLKKTRKELHKKPGVKNLEMSNPSFETEEQDEISSSAQPQRCASSFSSTPDTQRNEEEKDIHQADEQSPKNDDNQVEEHPHEHEISDRVNILGKEINSSSNGDGKEISNDISTIERDSMSSRDVSRKSGLSSDSVTQGSSSFQDSRLSYEGKTENPSPNGIERSTEEETLSSESHSKSTLRKVFHRRRKHKRYNSAKSAVERNLTFKMLAVSIVFILCFTPYFVVKILMREVLKSGEEYELNIGAQISLRLPYMNSVFNPVIYCLFNPQFRLYIKAVFLGLLSKCFGRTKYFFKS